MKNKVFKIMFIIPIVIYSVCFILLPLIYILALSFLKTDYYGGIIYNININNYLEIFTSTYLKVFLKSFAVGLITTLLCALISYPFALILRKKSDAMRSFYSKLIMVPFFTNSLIRTYGWIILLRKSGVINNALLSLNIIEKPLSLMYNTTGIIIGMTYTLLPFMLLPITSSVFKINKYLIEAGEDLGAGKVQIFTKIILPQTYTGLFNGALMTFMPAIGYFFISDILGGGKVMILGNLIKNEFLSSRNWPFGCAISIFIILMTLGLIKVYKKIGGNMDELGGM